MRPQLHFFVGKGGVGKSTLSAVKSVFLSQNKLETLLVSLDPAHNQRDIFQIDLSEKPHKIDGCLTVLEIDTEEWIKKYLREVQKNLKKTYRYQSAFNLQNHFNILQFSPGLEEYALILAFESILRKYAAKDVIVFDMAPTALTLRFFSMPFTTLTWLQELLKLRQKIHEKKEIISRIRIGKREVETDSVKAKLNDMIGDHIFLRDIFRSRRTNVVLVMNDDRLSFSEALRIKAKLEEIGIEIRKTVVNKAQNVLDAEEIKKAFADQDIVLLPFYDKGLLGYRALGAFVTSCRSFVAEF